MKIQIQLKDPDGIYDSITEAVDASLVGVNVEPREVEKMKALRRETIVAEVGPWVEYGDYVTIEVDTDTKTARVVPNSEKRA